MASKKYEAAHGRSKLAIVAVTFSVLAMTGTIAWLYSNPDAWLYTSNALQVHSVVTDLRKTLQLLESEIATLRRERPRAGAAGQVRASLSSELLVPDSEAANPTLARLLKKVAINKEVLVLLATKEVIEVLRLAVASIQRVGVRNYIVIALDRDSAAAADELHAPIYKRFDVYQPLSPTSPASDVSPTPVDRTGVTLEGRHISSYKFLLLRDFLVLGYSVLLSDVDVVYLQNPFSGRHLHRDSDVEAQTDGSTNRTSYGFLDEMEDPAMGACSIAFSVRLWTFNSGLFYLRPTVAALEFVDRVYARVSANPKLWDQRVYNEELLYPSRPGFFGLHATKRVMDYLSFMNSKTLFSIVRKDPTQFARPVTVHCNFHVAKAERMRAIVDFYVHGDSAALDPFPEGDPPRTT